MVYTASVVNGTTLLIFTKVKVELIFFLHILAGKEWMYMVEWSILKFIAEAQMGSAA